MEAPDAQWHEKGFFLERIGEGVRENLRAIEACARLALTRNSNHRGHGRTEESSYPVIAVIARHRRFGATNEREWTRIETNLVESSLSVTHLPNYLVPLLPQFLCVEGLLFAK
jgi:hypothetical protein